MPSRYLAIDSYFNRTSGTHTVVFYRSWQPGSGRRYRDPSKASLKRLADWVETNDVRVRPWATACGWKAELFIREGENDA